MRILLSNDDGYFAPGIEILARSLTGLGQVTVVAPERDRSGASNSLTPARPRPVRKSANGFLFVNGTPTDCVHLAVTGLLGELPDVVVSGINLGANMGDDTIYSGTVAAATEGYLLGIPSLAIPLASKAGRHFETAARIACEMVERFQKTPPGEPMLLNVNVPDVPWDELGGLGGRRRGQRAGRGAGDRFLRGVGEPCLGHAAADGSDAPAADCHGARLDGVAEMMTSKTRGIGMTSQRTRARRGG